MEEEENTKDSSSIYVDLTPIDNADSDGYYSDALNFALKNDKIQNIALTGPNGSGKSSIIKTFEKNNSNYNFLNISLASFDYTNADSLRGTKQKNGGKEQGDGKSDIDKNGETRLIELSILQQILYGTDAKLEYSRFKRIKTPSIYKKILSALFVPWLMLLAYILYRKEEFLTLDIFLSPPLDIFINLLLLGITVTYGSTLIWSLYNFSYGVSFKKISLTNMEIEAGDTKETSILNRHLDEIIYFFEETKYDVVVIEDLDRYKNPDIFIKLREINGLLNKNCKVARNINFVYAVKDDMFLNENRTKFFDFIIPVVPVINNYNSIDKLTERLERLPHKVQVRESFLRQVAFFINDLRLLNNIINEFVTYQRLLYSESIDSTKLFAMIVYKNTFPCDFHQLHHSSGILFEIVNSREELLSLEYKKVKDDIEKQQEKLKALKRERAASERELLLLYVGAILSKISIPTSAGHGVFGLIIDNEYISLADLPSVENIRKLREQNNIIVANVPRKCLGLNSGITFNSVEDDIDSTASFEQRLEAVEDKSYQKNILRRITELESSISELKLTPLCELFKDNEEYLKEQLSKVKEFNANLLQTLLLNGYIDESYYNYISVFYEGRITSQDRDFLFGFYQGEIQEPDIVVNNPKEVIEDIGEEYIGTLPAQNIAILDCLLEQNMEEFLENFLKCIIANYSDSRNFLKTYYRKGKRLNEFVESLYLEFPGIIDIAISAKDAELISYILRFVNKDDIINKEKSGGNLSEFLSKSGKNIFASELVAPSCYELLSELKVKFRDVSQLSKNSTLLTYIYENNLYSINKNNVFYLLESNYWGSVFKKSNYFSLLSKNDSAITEYLSKNLTTYVSDVLLKIDGDEEPEDSIIDLLSREELTLDIKERVIQRIDFSLSSLENVPEELYEPILRVQKVSINWDEVFIYFQSEHYDERFLTEILNNEEVYSELSRHRFASKEPDEDTSIKLSGYIFNNGELDDDSYVALLNSLPFYYKYFPDGLSNEKMLAIIRKRTVRLSTSNFDSLENIPSLQCELVIRNFDSYSEDVDSYSLSISLVGEILKSKLEPRKKLLIVQNCNQNYFYEDEKLSELLANLLEDLKLDDFIGLDKDTIKGVISSADSTESSLSLFIKTFELWREDDVMDILSELPEPYSSISIYGKRPKLVASKLNSQLAELLDSKGFISSTTEHKENISINTKQTRPD